MNMRFDTWNVRSLYRAGSFMTVAKEISGYKLELVGVQEVKWDRGGTEPAGEYKSYCGKKNENHEFGTVSFVCKRIISALKKVEFVSDRMPYVMLRGRWCDIIVHYSIHNSPSLVFHILRQINPVYTFPSYLRFILILPFDMSGSLQWP
jgi:hypothetical protein